MAKKTTKKKSNLKDVILAIVAFVGLALAVVGACLNAIAVKVTAGGASNTAYADFGDLIADGASNTAKAGFAFTIISIVVLAVLLLLMVLNLTGVAQKLAKCKCILGLLAIACVVVAFACITAVAADANGSALGIKSVGYPAEGTFLLLIGGLTAALCPLFIKRKAK